MEIRHILAPTDFSEYSREAISAAYELAERFGAKLSLLYVVELPPYPLEGFVPSTMGTSLLNDLEQDAERELAKLLTDVRRDGVLVARRVVVGTPYRRIVEVAEEEKADLIVMATHGRTGFGHLVMGSVAERVVRHAPCPVLTIRPAAAA